MTVTGSSPAPLAPSTRPIRSTSCSVKASNSAARRTVERRKARSRDTASIKSLKSAANATARSNCGCARDAGWLDAQMVLVLPGGRLLRLAERGRKQNVKARKHHGCTGPETSGSAPPRALARPHLLARHRRRREGHGGVRHDDLHSRPHHFPVRRAAVAHHQAVLRGPHGRVAGQARVPQLGPAGRTSTSLCATRRRLH